MNDTKQNDNHKKSKYVTAVLTADISRVLENQLTMVIPWRLHNQCDIKLYNTLKQYNNVMQELRCS